MSQPKRWHPYTDRDKYTCKDCTERSRACQDRCERYQAVKRDADARKAVERKKRIAECGAAEILYENMLRNQRKKLPQR